MANTNKKIIEFYVIKSQRGNYFRGKRLGWSPFLVEALLITNLDIISDVFDIKQIEGGFAQIQKLQINNIGGGKATMKEIPHIYQ